MITTNLTGNLGNHMWQYAVCRAVAQKLGYEWGINPSPTHDYYNGMNQMYFMDVDFGKPVEGIINDFYEKWSHYLHNGDNVNITKLDKRIFSIPDNVRLIGDNGAFGGIYQSEDYFIDIKNDVLSWFKINPEKSLEYEKKLNEYNITLNDDLCVINFRGGEYRGIPNVIVRREYWEYAINHMISLNKNMKFIIITDDPDCAKSHMPFDIPTYHLDIGFDFYVVNKSRWVILSNSTFGWWAAWLNTVANKIFAPKYWARHNISDGYWSVGDSYTRGFTYIDREGNLFDYDTCKAEAEEYYELKKLF
jgi:hypothetical protein